MPQSQNQGPQVPSLGATSNCSKTRGDKIPKNIGHKVPKLGVTGSKTRGHKVPKIGAESIFYGISWCYFHLF